MPVRRLKTKAASDLKPQQQYFRLLELSFLETILFCISKENFYHQLNVTSNCH